jgi:hypothetical protein
MASFKYGKDYRVLVAALATPTVFQELGGEGQFEINSSSDKVDFSSKDDSGINASGFGNRAIDMPISGKLKLPDAGLQIVFDASIAPVKEAIFQAKDMVADAVIFECRMGVGNFKRSAPNKEGVSWSVDTSAVAAPTVDLVDAA